MTMMMHIPFRVEGGESTGELKTESLAERDVELSRLETLVRLESRLRYFANILSARAEKKNSKTNYNMHLC